MAFSQNPYVAALAQTARPTMPLEHMAKLLGRAYMGGPRDPEPPGPTMDAGMPGGGMNNPGNAGQMGYGGDPAFAGSEGGMDGKGGMIPKSVMEGQKGQGGKC